MSKILINISELKGVMSRINLAVEKTKFNPKSGWIELETVSSDLMTVKVSNYDYYLEANVSIDCDSYTDEDKIHATVTAETFIPLVSKLDEDSVEMSIRMNSLVLTTKSSEYTYPIIKELDRVRSVDTIAFNPTRCSRYRMSGEDLASIARKNVKGLIDTTFSKEIQQFIIVDNNGALTFTENIYVNSFVNPCTIDDEHPAFKFLLNATQAKLLEVFGVSEFVECAVEATDDYSSSFKVKFTSVPDNAVSLTLIAQSAELTDKFPSVQLRKLASDVKDTHAIIDKKALEKALARLMVFDKKWDITVLNYSKLVFDEKGVKLVSVKNKNYEYVPYKNAENTTKHEAIVRFSDLERQLKAIGNGDIDVSYGDARAITLNDGNLCLIIPEVVERV